MNLTSNGPVQDGDPQCLDRSKDRLRRHRLSQPVDPVRYWPERVTPRRPRWRLR